MKVRFASLGHFAHGVTKAIPAPLHRALLRVAHRIRLRIWGLLRLELRGTNALVFDPAGRVLLVRHSYHHAERWLLPGGGIARGEQPEATAAREVLEETHCRMATVNWFTTIRRPMREGWTNRLELVCGTTEDRPRADGRELLEAAFFTLDALPPTTAKTTHEVIAVWQAWAASNPKP